MEKLSKHDEEIDKKIRRLDDESYFNWPEMIHLAKQLESKELYEYWNRVCIRYNHLEEASVGNL